MTLKHSKYGTSELLDLVLSNQPAPPVKKVASAEVSYKVTGDLLDDVISLADGLRARGFTAQAEALEEKLFIREAAKKKVEKAQKAEKTVLDEAHPDGDVEVSKSQSGMGKVWTEQSAKQEILKKVLKTPTGKYASMGAAVSLLASKMAIQFGAYLSEAMDRHLPEGGNADDIVDAVEGHLAEVLAEQTQGYPANLVNETAEEFISRASRESDELAQRMAADSKKFEDYDFDQAYRILAAELLIKAAVAVENDYGKEGTTASSKLDDILKEAGQVLGLSKVANYDVRPAMQQILKNFIDPLVNSNTNLSNQERMEAYNKIGGALYSSMNQIRDNVLDTNKSGVGDQNPEDIPSLMEIYKSKVQSAINNVKKQLMEADSRNSFAQIANDRIYGAKDALIADYNRGNLNLGTAKLTSRAEKAIATYQSNYATPLRKAATIFDQIIELYIEIYSGTEQAEAVFTRIPALKSAKQLALSKANWAVRLLKTDRGIKTLNTYFGDPNNFPSKSNLEKWTSQVSQAAGLPAGSPSDLVGNLETVKRGLQGYLKDASSNLEELQKLAQASNPLLPPPPGAKTDSAKKDQPDNKKTPGKYDGVGRHVVAMQRKLHELGKLLESKKYKNAKAVGDTRGFGGWGSGTDSALSAAQEAMKVYQVNGTLKTSPKNDVTAKENITLLEQLQKAVETGKPSSKEDEAIEIMIDNTPVSLEEKDLANLSTLFNALSLQGAPFSGLSTGIRPTEETKTRPMAGGRPIKTEL